MSDKFDFTFLEIKEMVRHYDFKGFAGDGCLTCGTTVNILYGTVGWTCPKCGNFNGRPYATRQPLVEIPDYGPPAELILRAYREIHDTRQI